VRLLQVEGLEKRFFIHHLGREIPVFDRLDFTVDEGEFIHVSGVNGAGKSSLLRCLYRSYLATGGHAYYQSWRGSIDLVCAADVDIAILRREEIGFVTQFLNPRPRVSALELVAEPLLNAGSDLEPALERAREMLSAFGLKQDLWGAYPTTFSGGEQQKVNLARALIHPFRLLLLDEPTASLDSAARVSLTARLRELKTQGVAIIGIFHHPQEIQHLIDQEVRLTLPTTENDYVVE